MRLRYFLFFLLTSIGLVSQAQSPSSFIHVDQFGYLPGADKIAVLSDPQVGFNANLSYNPAGNLELRDATTNTSVFSASADPWNNGSTHAQSGDRGWWFDFTSFSTPGEYYVFDPATGERSATFSIDNNPYAEVMRQAGRMFYYNRCNATKALPYAAADWQDGMNFMNTNQDGQARYVYDSLNPALVRDMSGGWFDAGDYNKYVTFAHGAVHNLLWAYEENPNAFGDNWNLPESGNGIPDLLDELRWELEWMAKMTNPDGSCHIKLGTVGYSTNGASPPSLNTGPRFYGPTCTSASITIASVFALAARVYGAYASLTSFAQDLQDMAVAAWNYVLPHLNNNTLETGCDDGTISSGDADVEVLDQRDQAVGAAAYLFALTGDSSYHNYFRNHYASTEPIANGFWGPYGMALKDALLLYSEHPQADPLVRSAIRNSFTDAANNNYNGFFGFNGDDLYRAFMPDWAYHWGSNRPRASFGTLNTLLPTYALVTNNAPYESKALEQLHFFHGVNPLGMVHLSNMYDHGGDHCVNQIYHTWFHDGTNWDDVTTSLGPPPGYISGGPNANFSVTSLSPPAGQPEQKSYLDFNDDWPNNSWEISEPGIYYQAAYLRLLANYVDGNTVTAVAAPIRSPLEVFPNPTNGKMGVRGLNAGSKLQILDLEGRIVWEILTPGIELQLDLSEFPAGLYILRGWDPSGLEYAPTRLILK